MKRFISFLVVCVILSGISSVGGVALARAYEPANYINNEIYISPHASQFLSSYGAWASRSSSGVLLVEFSVNATTRFERVGALTITIQERNGSTWRSVATLGHSTTSGMMGSNAVVHNGRITHSSTAGTELRAVVTVFAGNVSGDQRTIATNSVFV